MSMLGTQQPEEYLDGRTKQSFKDETDINKILKRAQKTGTISHMNKHSGNYGDFTGFDFFEAQLMLSKGREIFDDLPSEIRNEFGQSQAAFFKYVNDPKNKERLDVLLPGLSAPGKQNIDVSGITPADVSAQASPTEGNTPLPEASGPKENAAGDVSEPPQNPQTDENP